ncbi:serine protease, partial [Fusobacterium necrophorum]|nr:serine protease [Fusobacterium necrophorum]
MNNVLELKGKRFVQARRNGNGGGIAMNGRIEVTTGHLLRLQSQLKQIKEFWDKETKPFEGILVSVYYNKIVAKSNRIAGLFKGTDSNDSIVGAKFNKDKSNHIITYFLDENDLIKSIELISNTLNILSEKFSGSIN